MRSVKYTCGLTPFNLQVSTNEARQAQFSAPSLLPANPHCCRQPDAWRARRCWCRARCGHRRGTGTILPSGLAHSGSRQRSDRGPAVSLTAPRLTQCQITGHRLDKVSARSQPVVTGERPIEHSWLSGATARLLRALSTHLLCGERREIIIRTHGRAAPKAQRAMLTSNSGSSGQHGTIAASRASHPTIWRSVVPTRAP
jgi:hypothetical protein